MINNKKVVVVIPARAGSKSVPDKNIRMIAGKPLIGWSIDVAKKTKYVDRVIVSTDGDAISRISKEFGAEVFKRPPELARDDSLVIDAIRCVIAELTDSGYDTDYLVLLEPTSPLRLPSDVDEVVERLVLGGHDSVATFREAELNPHRAWKVVDGQVKTFIDGAVPWLPRQKLPEAWQLNGAVYGVVANRLPSDGISLLFGKVGYVIMPHDRSLDIDNRIQFMMAESMLKDKVHD